MHKKTAKAGIPGIVNKECSINQMCLYTPNINLDNCNPGISGIQPEWA
jgi:hypothetical protein